MKEGEFAHVKEVFSIHPNNEQAFRAEGRKNWEFEPAWGGSSLLNKVVESSVCLAFLPVASISK